MYTNYLTRYLQAKKEFSNAQTDEEIKQAFYNLKIAFNNLKAVS